MRLSVVSAGVTKQRLKERQNECPYFGSVYLPGQGHIIKVRQTGFRRDVKCGKAYISTFND